MHFWKPWKHAFWPPPGCQESFDMLPGHALSSIMVQNAGVGPWWAATAKKTSGSGQHLRVQTVSTNKLTAFKKANLYFTGRHYQYVLGVQQNRRDPKQFSGQCLIVNRTFPCQKGVQNRTFTPDPRTFTKMSAILLQTPLVSCWHQGGAFGNPLFTGISTLPTWAPPATN